MNDQQHPIEGLMKTAMESIKEMTDVNTVVGDAVEAPDGTVIIPISRVSCGFAAGGSEFSGLTENQDKTSHPFGGGSGAGMSVQPVGFLVVGQGQVRLMPVDGHNTYLERLVDMAPQVIDKIQSMLGDLKNSSGQKTTAETNGENYGNTTKIQ
ncbi:MAG: sporulation protein YtfJ [Firmicutes bacterium HGW-Firmicutes-12]|jgi:sporulation protein YtfJ|nr:MAG: sporulation protein YtfJ [Firmicutes bacterium HGW-Firmicutes-12]